MAHNLIHLCISIVVMVVVVIMMACQLAEPIAAQSNITTIAGTGPYSYNGDGILAINAELNAPYGVAVNSLGEVFIADTVNFRIRKIQLNGIITTIAGTGTPWYNGDGMLATSTNIWNPSGIVVNSLGEVIFSECSDNSRILKILLNGTMVTIAGTGTLGFNGDNRLATSATLNMPFGIALNSLGEVLIADSLNNRVRKIQLNGLITTIAGTGVAGYNGDSRLATTANLNNPTAISVNSLGEVLFADRDNHRIRKILLNGTIITIAGTGVAGCTGDGIQATSSTLNYPTGVAVNSLGEVLISDRLNHRILKIRVDGILTTIAGTGDGGYNGDNRLATSANLNFPLHLAVNSLGEVLIADHYNNRIRKLSASCPPNSIPSGKQCICLNGYFGLYCDKFNCSNIANTRSDVCSSHGQCVSPNTCQCNSGFSGTNCNQCSAGFTGANCDLYQCNNILSSDPTVCSSSGKCVSPSTCACNTGYLGSNCETFKCFEISKDSQLVCSGVGTCKGPDQCECPKTSSSSEFIYTSNCTQTLQKSDPSASKTTTSDPTTILIAALVPSLMSALLLVILLVVIIVWVVICARKNKK